MIHQSLLLLLLYQLPMSHKPNQKATPPPFTSFLQSRDKQKQRKEESGTRMEIGLQEEIRPPLHHETEESRVSMQQAIERANLLFGNPPAEVGRKKVRDPEREAIEKNYAAFVGLGYPVLKQINDDVEKYTAQEKRDRRGLEFLRFSNRRELIKIFLIGLAEAKQRNISPINAVEGVLLKPGMEYLALMTIQAQVIEDYLFKKLYRENVKSREQPYQVKMNSIKRQALDKTNFELRRSLINKSITCDDLLRASEEDLKSQERKQDEKLTIQILVRESQSWENSQYKKQLKEDKDDRDETVPQAARQEISFDKEEQGENQLEKEYQASVKMAYEVFRKCKREMQERLRNLVAPLGKRLLRNLQVTMRRQ